MFSGHRQLQAHQQQLDQGDEEEAERTADEDAAEVLVVGAGRQLDPARPAPAWEAVDDELGTRLLAHGVSLSLISFTTRSWAVSMSAFCCLTKASYASGETTSTAVRIAA